MNTDVLEVGVLFRWGLTAIMRRKEIALWRWVQSESGRGVVVDEDAVGGGIARTEKGVNRTCRGLWIRDIE